MRQTAIESIIPATLMQKNQQEVMRTQHLAVCRANLDSTTCVFQVGREITETQKMHIVLCGKKDNKAVTIVFSVDHRGVISTEQVTAFDNLTLVSAVSEGKKVLLQTTDKLILFNVSQDKNLVFNQVH